MGSDWQIMSAGLPPGSVEVLEAAGRAQRGRNGNKSFVAVMPSHADFPGSGVEGGVDRFVDNTLRSSLMVGLGAGSLVSSGVRLVALSRLGTSTLGQSLGPSLSYLAASGTAFAVEVPTVFLGSHFTEAFLHPQVDSLNFAEAGSSMKSLALMLGWLRVGGAVFRGIFNAGHGVHPLSGQITRGEAFTRISQALSQQLGMFSGLYAYHRTGHHFGAHQAMDSEKALSKSLSDLLLFNAAGRVSNHFWGPRYMETLKVMEQKILETHRLGRGDGWSPVMVTPEGIHIRVETSSNTRSHWEDLLNWARSPDAKQKGPGRGRKKRGRGIDLNELAETPAKAVEVFSRLSYVQAQRLLKKIFRNGNMAHLALAWEGKIKGQEALVESGKARLSDLEMEFAEFLKRKRETVSVAQRRESFRSWQNEMNAWRDLGMMDSRAAIYGIAAKGRIAAVRLRDTVVKNKDLVDYFFDLHVVREFLKHKELDRYSESNGKTISGLLTQGDGNCLTLSLLFAHFASRAGRYLDIGLTPRHLYLITPRGGAIESTLGFAMSLHRNYRKYAIPSEQDPVQAHYLPGFHWLNVGRLSAKGRLIKAAQDSFEAARKILPENPRPYLELGWLYLALGKYKKAAAALRLHAKLHPLPYNQLEAEAWHALGHRDFPKAEELFLWMMDLKPEDLRIYKGLEITYRELGQVEKVEEIRRLGKLVKALK